MVLFKDLEDTFYKYPQEGPRVQQPALAVPDQGARRRGQGHDRRRPSSIGVKAGQDDFDLVIQAKTRRAAHRPERQARPRLLRPRRDPELQQGRGRHADQRPHAGDPDPRPTASSTSRRRSRNTPTREIDVELREQRRADRDRAAAAGDHGRVPVRVGPVRPDQLVRGPGRVRRPRLLAAAGATSWRRNGGSGCRWPAAACCS